MGQAKRPACAWCGYEGYGPTHGLHGKQDLVQRRVEFVYVWLHLQCEHIYREIVGPPRPAFHDREARRQ